MSIVVAVIGDIVESRKKPDRADTQRAVERALDHANNMAHPLQRLAPTVGDEFQGVFTSLADAIMATLLVRLHLPEGTDCRFGIGRGERAVVASSPSTLEDGSAWWSARSAIEEVKKREGRSNRSLRTWYLPHDRELSNHDLINAHLVCRDELVSRFDGRGRRILLGTIKGRTQSQIADDEGITQSAVSQAIAKNGSYAILTSSQLVERSALDVDAVTAVHVDRA
jgi:hypothetical protein